MFLQIIVKNFSNFNGFISEDNIKTQIEKYFNISRTVIIQIVSKWFLLLDFVLQFVLKFEICLRNLSWYNLKY